MVHNMSYQLKRARDSAIADLEPPGVFMQITMNTSVNYGTPLPRPYQCFMGRWEGLCKTFDARGQFIEAAAVHMNVYWIDEDTWHLHEYFENLYENRHSHPHLAFYYQDELIDLQVQLCFQNDIRQSQV